MLFNKKKIKRSKVKSPKNKKHFWENEEYNFDDKLSDEEELIKEKNENLQQLKTDRRISILWLELFYIYWKNKIRKCIIFISIKSKILYFT